MNDGKTEERKDGIELEYDDTVGVAAICAREHENAAIVFFRDDSRGGKKGDGQYTAGAEPPSQGSCGMHCDLPVLDKKRDLYGWQIRSGRVKGYPRTPPIFLQGRVTFWGASAKGPARPAMVALST